MNSLTQQLTKKKKKINMGEDGNKIAIKNTLVMNMA